MTSKPAIDPELQALIPPLAPHEYQALESSIVQHGRALEPVRVWALANGDRIIVDGHNRFGICERLDLPYRVEEMAFKNRAEVKAWMVQHQSARRSLTRWQLLVLHLMNDQNAPDGNTPQECTLATEAIRMGMGPDILSGALTKGMTRNRVWPKARPPKSPERDLPPGHELERVTHQKGAAGETQRTWDKSRIERARDPDFDPEEHGHLVERATISYAGDGSILAQHLRYSPEEKTRQKAILEAWERHAALYAGLIAAVPAPEITNADLITLYPIGDPHIGMLAWAPEAGENFDTDIAVRELVTCMRMLVDDAPASERCIITNLGDALHAQDDTRKTPGHGNLLDVDGRFARVLDAAHAMFRTVVDSALKKHKTVHFRNLPGNHDPRVAAELMMWLRAVYEREPRVIVEDAYDAHQYDEFGVNLFGWHHGDRTPGSELGAVMAEDQPKAWGRTWERVWHCGHVHHKSKDKEHPGVYIETHRTLAAKDAWHAGRYRAGRSLQAITYHRVYGEHCRNVMGIRRVKEAILRAAA